MWRCQLDAYRTKRSFDPSTYLNQKINLINTYFRRTGITCPIIGVSGGIDSSLVLIILALASKAKDSPITKIVAVMIPQFVEGTTGQMESVIMGDQIINMAQSISRLVDKLLIDASNTCLEINDVIHNHTKWGKGQLVSYTRTPILYGLTSKYFDQGFPSCLCGTTNYSEGGYIGYFGKGSDGCVDLQIISDLYKSEVFLLSHYLDLPKDIVESDPKGDLYNGITDEEYIGVPYDYLELYMGYLRGETELPSVEKYNLRIEELHNQSSHKYFGMGYSVHLNLYSIGIKGGWQDRTYSTETDLYHFINLQPINLVPFLTTHQPIFSDNVSSNFLTEMEVDQIVDHIDTVPWIPVGLNGILRDYCEEDEIGSYRMSYYSSSFSNLLWNRMKHQIKVYCDHDNNLWRPIGVNPLFRFIKYDKGYLVPHYDSPYDYGDGRKTLISVVIYLTQNEDGGTRFLKGEIDPEYKDWDRSPEEDEIGEIIYPEKGKCIFFDHRTLHDSQPNTEQKIIIRTDIIFESIISMDLVPTKPLNFNREEYCEKHFQLASTKYTREQLVKGGYMNVIRKEEIPYSWLGTPFDKLNFISGKVNYVLINTGCYDPIHKGHLEMMQLGKEYFKERHIAGGYLVPANSRYVIEKNKRDNLSDRLRKCFEMVKDSDWLDIDPYEAIYSSDDYNFTDIINRIMGYLRTHFDYEIQPIYVFGGDRSEFGRAFIGKGECLCINRVNNIDKFLAMKTELKDYPKIHYFDGVTNYALSSTDLRGSETESPKSGKYYLLRIDDDSGFFPPSEYKSFCLKLKHFIEKEVDVEVRFVSSKEYSVKKPNCVSIDPFVKGPYNLDICRLFSIGSLSKCRHITNRPLTLPLSEQIKLIAHPSVVLLDDDIATGTTMQQIEDLLLTRGIRVDSKETIFESKNALDVCDCRDFLIGTPKGGLVVTLPNSKVTRVPYMLPYVFPSVRATFRDDYLTSLQLWKMNLIFYHRNNILLEDLDETCKELYLYLGFNGKHPMEFIAYWHYYHLYKKMGNI